MSTSTRFHALVLSWILLAVCALAQAPTGQVNGIVFDQSGAVIPGAEVTLTNPETGASRKVTSGTDGIFSFPSLQAGNYQVRCEAKGFRTLVQPLAVQTGVVAALDLHMQVGHLQYLY